MKEYFTHERVYTYAGVKFSFRNVHSISSLPRAKSIHRGVTIPEEPETIFPRQNSTSTLYIYIHRALKLRSPQGLGIFDDQKRPLFKIPVTEFLSLHLVAKQRHLASNSRYYSSGQRISVLISRDRHFTINLRRENLIVKVNFDNVQSVTIRFE